MGCCYGQPCVTSRNQTKGKSPLESEMESSPKRKYKCLRKFLAIVCSQMGLLVLIVLYLIGGTFLFTYLERDSHQSRLNNKVLKIENTFQQLADSSQVRRSPGWQVKADAQKLGLKCMELQLQTLQKEINRLQLSLSSERLRDRGFQLGRTMQEVISLTPLEETQQLEEVLMQSVEINLTTHIKVFENLLMLPESRSMPDMAASVVLLNDFVRAVYEAVIAGWVPPAVAPSNQAPPKQAPSIESSPTEAPFSSQSRSIKLGHHPRPNAKSILDARPPRTDPWTLGGSMFFVITVITTIGYGQVVPVTTYGRLATVFYGTFGIPMMLLFLANLGSLMADIFRILYKNICCCFLRERKCISPIPTPSTSCADAKARSKSDCNKPKISTSTPPLSLRTPPGRIGFGSLPKTSQKYPPRASALQELMKKTLPLPGATDSLFITLAGSNSVFTKALQTRKESRNVRIPVWLILCLFVIYMMIGATVFACWEQWSFLDAMYFVFVTVSTIGFGDMIPGMNDEHAAHRANKLLAAIAYLLLGLAMVAMCFDLIQLEIKRRTRRLAKRIGLVSSS